MRKIAAVTLAFGAITFFGIGAMFCIAAEVIDPVSGMSKYRK